MPTPTLPRLNADHLGLARTHRPERVLQFGEGAFLRGFVDWMFHRLAERGLFDGAVVVVQPLAFGLIEEINRQDGLFTLVQRGVTAGQVCEEIEIVRSISRGLDPFRDFAGFLACARDPDLRFIVSNTTEAGIACHPDDRPDAEPPASFPAKLLRLLMERHRAFGGSAASGLVVLPCELIEANGENLRRCVRSIAEAWHLDARFLAWLDRHVMFCNTLVDRIVTGHPREESADLAARLGYTDALLDTCEPFHAWIIEGPAWLADELPFARAGLNVIFTDDYKPYRDRKVRILNGAHTATVLAAHLAGHDMVKQTLDDPLFAAFLDRTLKDEILPTLDLPRADLAAFASAVLERFANPFVKHPLLSISLNSTSKFAARVLPSIEIYCAKRGVPPPCLAYAFAALLAFYRGSEIRDGSLIGRRPAGDEYAIKDNPEVLTFFHAIWSAPDHAPATIVRAALGRRELWAGRVPLTLPGLAEAVTEQLIAIQSLGASAALESLLAR